MRLVGKDEGVLRDRGDPETRALDPGLPRRSARHGHHLGGGAAQRARHRRQEDRRGEGGLQRRRGGGDQRGSRPGAASGDQQRPADHDRAASQSPAVHVVYAHPCRTGAFGGGDGRGNPGGRAGATTAPGRATSRDRSAVDDQAVDSDADRAARITAPAPYRPADRPAADSRAYSAARGFPCGAAPSGR